MRVSSDLLIWRFSLSLTQVYARTRALVTVPLSGLIYSTHIFSLSLLYVPSFLCLCLLEASRCPALLARGAYRGLPALRGACFAALVSFSWLPVRAGPELHAGRLRPEKDSEPGGTSGSLKTQTECLTLQKRVNLSPSGFDCLSLRRGEDSTSILEFTMRLFSLEPNITSFRFCFGFFFAFLKKKKSAHKLLHNTELNHN